MSNEVVVSNYKAVEATLNEKKSDLGALMKVDGEGAEKFVQNALLCIKRDPKLLECNRTSLFVAVHAAAQDGLMLDNREAALVRFKSVVQYMPMIGGITKRLHNTGTIGSITTAVVYANDEFEWILGDEEQIVHRPKLGNRGDPIAVYAIVRTKAGFVYREVLSADDVAGIQKVSKNQPLWNGAFKGEMWRKSALRRLAKRMEQSDVVIAAFETHDSGFEFNQPGAPDDPDQTVDDSEPTVDAKTGEVIEGDPASKAKDVSPKKAPKRTKAAEALAAAAEDGPQEPDEEAWAEAEAQAASTPPESPDLF